MFILNFHGLGAPGAEVSHSEETYWTDPALFAGVLEMVKMRPDVLITLDDSNETDYSVALPLLKAARITARFFVVAARVDQKGYLSTQQIQELVREGMTIGSHGLLHRKWPALDDKELHRECKSAQELLRGITGRPILEAACPFGAYNRRVLKWLRASGYRRVLTSDEGPAAQESWIWPRNTIVRTDDLARVAKIINHVPSGPRTVYRRLKLLAKRWR